MSLLRSRIVSQPMAAPGGGRYKTLNPDAKGRFRWSEVDAEAIFTAIAAVTALGDSILFGKTKEGDCGFLMVLSGGLADKFYPSTSKEAEDQLEAILQVASRSEPP